MIFNHTSRFQRHKRQRFTALRVPAAKITDRDKNLDLFSNQARIGVIGT